MRTQCDCLLIMAQQDSLSLHQINYHRDDSQPSEIHLWQLIWCYRDTLIESCCASINQTVPLRFPVFSDLLEVCSVLAL